MAYTQKNLSSFARGDTWTLKFTVKDSDGNAVDITGNSYWMTLKSSATAEDSSADAQIGPIGSGSPESTSGIIYMTFSSTLTETLSPGTYNYDLQEVDSSSNITTLLIGKVKVVRDITRTTS